MTATLPPPIDLDTELLRGEIQKEYAEVALHPEKGFHFHTGRPLARMLGYQDEWLAGVPERSIESFAGSGLFWQGATNPWYPRCATTDPSPGCGKRKQGGMWR